MISIGGESSVARKDINLIGFSIIALILLQVASSVAVFYFFALSTGAHIVFYGFSPGAVVKTISGIKAAAASNVMAMPAALFIATLVGNLLPFSLCAHASGIKTRSLYRRPAVGAGTAALFGITALGASISVSILLGLLSLFLKFTHWRLTTPALSIPWKSPAAAAVMLITVVVIAPVTEEYIFRGVVLNAFKRFGGVFAVVGSSLLWALLHGNIIQGIPVFAMGLFFGVLALKSESLIPTIILHSLNNLLSTIETSAASGGGILPKLGISAFNFTILITAVILASVFYKKFGGIDGKGTKSGFKVLFTSVPALVALGICAAMTVFSIKPM